jgi:hypothetical protein
MGYRDYSTAKGHIVDAKGHGDFTTIGAALSAASSGQTIFIRPGTYTENPALVAGVDLVAYVTDSDIPNVVIQGECTFSSAGSVGLSGIQLETNSNFCLAVTGSAASIVYLTDCYINCTNNTGISFSSSSASAVININSSTANLTTTGIAVFSHSSAGTLNITNSNFSNTGLSTTNNTLSGSGGIVPNFSQFGNGFTITGTGAMVGSACEFVMATNQTCLTLSTSTGSANLSYSEFVSGTPAAISIGASNSLQLHYCLIASGTSPPIAGTGTLSFTHIAFNSVAGLAAGLTLSEGSMNVFIGAGGVGTSGQVLTSNGVTSPPTWQTAAAGGAMVLLHTASASSSASIAFSSTYITGTYKNYVLTWNNVTAATTSTTLELTISSNNGSSYITSGYTAVDFYGNSTTGAFGEAATTYIPMSGASVFSTSNQGSGMIWLWNLNTATFPMWNGYYGFPQSNNSSNPSYGLTYGYYATDITVNNIKIAFSSGNISAGTFSLYGISS